MLRRPHTRSNTMDDTSQHTVTTLNTALWQRLGILSSSNGHDDTKSKSTNGFSAFQGCFNDQSQDMPDLPMAPVVISPPTNDHGAAPNMQPTKSGFHIPRAPQELTPMVRSSNKHSHVGESGIANSMFPPITAEEVNGNVYHQSTTNLDKLEDEVQLKFCAQHTKYGIVVQSNMTQSRVILTYPAQKFANCRAELTLVMDSGVSVDWRAFGYQGVFGKSQNMYEYHISKLGKKGCQDISFYLRPLSQFLANRRLRVKVEIFDATNICLAMNMTQAFLTRTHVHDNPKMEKLCKQMAGFVEPEQGNTGYSHTIDGNQISELLKKMDDFSQKVDFAFYNTNERLSKLEEKLDTQSREVYEIKTSIHRIHDACLKRKRREPECI